jgi:long-chain acyl-CoA synthetase
VAFVVVDPESVDRIEQIATEIMDHVATQVAPYQKIREVYVLDELPSTQTGKIRKNELRDSLAP